MGVHEIVEEEGVPLFRAQSKALRDWGSPPQRSDTAAERAPEEAHQGSQRLPEKYSSDSRRRRGAVVVVEKPLEKSRSLVK